MIHSHAGLNDCQGSQFDIVLHIGRQINPPELIFIFCVDYTIIQVKIQFFGFETEIDGMTCVRRIG